MNILIVQANFALGKIVDNVHKMLSKISLAREADVSLVIFPAFPFLTPAISTCEGSVDFCVAHKNAMESVIQESRDVDILFTSWAMDTKDMVLYHLHKGAIQTQTTKTTYSFILQEKVVGVYWGEENTLPTFRSTIDYLVHILTQPYTIYRSTQRSHYIYSIKEKYPHVYYMAINNVGTHKAQIYEGGSYVNGHHLPYFEEKDYVATCANEFSCSPSFSSFSTDLTIPPPLLPKLYQALTYGIRDYFQKVGIVHFIIGLSGGLDSALCLALLARSVDRQKILAVLMPSPFSSEHSVTDALALCENIGVPYLTLPIHSLYDTALKSLQPVFEGTPFNVAEENLQSRLRALLLMGIANKQQRILVNTSNKSELCMGYGTLYGDLCGGLSPLGDLYKMQVYALAHYVNTLASTPLIPLSILEKAPSAELNVGQKDSDTLPDYPILDSLLFDMIERQKSRQELQALGYAQELLDFVYHRLFSNQYKQQQFVPILQCSMRPLRGNIV